MTIDIIDLNDPQYSNLSSLQLAMVRAAQVKKNELVAAAEEEKRSLMYLMLSHNTARSMTRVYEEERIDARTNEQIDAFYAQFSPSLDGMRRRKLKKLVDELKRM